MLVCLFVVVLYFLSLVLCCFLFAEGIAEFFGAKNLLEINCSNCFTQWLITSGMDSDTVGTWRVALSHLESGTLIPGEWQCG